MKKTLSLTLALVLLAVMAVPVMAADRTNDANKIIMTLTEKLYPVDGAAEAQATFATEFAAFLLTVPQSDTLSIDESLAWLEGTLGGKEMADTVQTLYDCWVKGDTAALSKHTGGSPAPAGDSVPEPGWPSEAGTTTSSTPVSGDGWDGIWTMGGNTLAIVDNGQRMYHVNTEGQGFSISIMDDDITATEIHATMHDPMVNYRADYHFILSGDSLDFTHIYYLDGNDPITIGDSGLYTRVDGDPYAKYDELRGKKTTTPSESTPPALIARPTSSAVLVNGQSVAFDAYNIEGNNYFKLRDLAFILSGSETQFDVGWDEASRAISLTRGTAYTPVGGEMEGKGSGDKTPTATTSKIFLDGTEVHFTAYNIDGNNYFKLRDVGETMDFNVSWDAANNTIVIATDERYTAD